MQTHPGAVERKYLVHTIFLEAVKQFHEKIVLAFYFILFESN